MPNLMQNAATWLGGQLQTAAGRTVSIQQGKQFIASIVAASCATVEYQVMDTEGMLTALVMNDWTFVIADLVAEGIELRSGAILTETLNGVSRSYEAMPVGSKSAVEELDSAGILLTVHTKRVED